MPALFPLGRTTVTRTVSDSFSRLEMANLFHLHLSGDPGLLDADDIKTNAHALVHGDRIFNKYESSAGPVYVITEADRSATTILFPDGY